MPSGRHRALRHLPPAAMVSLALLCLASQAAALAHVVLVAHAACAEHGEWIDARAGEGPRHAAPLPSNDPSLATTGGAAAAHSHDHCTVATQRDNPRPVGPLALAVTSGPERVAGVEPGACPSAPLDALDVAPKSSPPA